MLKYFINILIACNVIINLLLLRLLLNYIKKINKKYLYFLLFNFFLLSWQTTSLILNSGQDLPIEIQKLLLQFDFISAGLGVLFLVFFTSEHLKQKIYKLRILNIFLSLIFLIIIIFFPEQILGKTYINQRYIPQNVFLNKIFATHLLSEMYTIIYLIQKALKGEKNNQEKLKIKYFRYGILLPISFIALIHLILLRSLNQQIILNNLQTIDLLRSISSLSTITIPIFSYISITRYHLFSLIDIATNIKFIIKSFLFTSLVSIIAFTIGAQTSIQPFGLAVLLILIILSPSLIQKLFLHKTRSEDTIIIKITQCKNLKDVYHTSYKYIQGNYNIHIFEVFAANLTEQEVGNSYSSRPETYVEFDTYNLFSELTQITEPMFTNQYKKSHKNLYGFCKRQKYELIIPIITKQSLCYLFLGQKNNQEPITLTDIRRIQEVGWFIESTISQML